MVNDRHLIDPPEPDEIPVGNCEECGETLLAYFEIYKDNLIRFAKGEPLRHTVDKEKGY